MEALSMKFKNVIPPSLTSRYKCFPQQCITGTIHKYIENKKSNITNCSIIKKKRIKKTYAKKVSKVQTFIGKSYTL